MSEKVNKLEPTYRIGTMGYYLREYGWEPVNVPGQFPLWQKDNQTLEGHYALYEVYREIWRRTHQRQELT